MKHQKDIEQLISALLADCLQSQNVTELFNALNRLKIGAESAEIILNLNVK